MEKPIYMSATGGTVSRRQEVIARKARSLIIPVVILGFIFLFWIYMHMAAQAWARAVTEPLLNNSRYHIGEVWLAGEVDSIGLFNSASDVPGFEKDIQVKSLMLRKVEGGAIREIFLYQYPTGSIEIHFTDLSVPKEILKTLKLSSEYGAENDELSVFSGYVRLFIDQSRRVKIEKFFDVIENKTKVPIPTDDLIHLETALNKLIPDERF